MLRLLIPRIVRFHSLCMFFIFVAYSGLFVLHLFGLLDEFAEEAGHFAEKLYAKFCGNKLAKQAAAARTLDHPEPPRPAYTDPYIAHLTKAQNETFVKTGKLSKSDRRRGFKLIKGDDLMVKKLHAKDGEVNGVLRKKGEPKFTWEHIKDTTAYNYDIGLIRKYKAALNGIKSNNLPNPSRRSRLEDADKEDRYALTLENIGSLTEIIYDTEEEAEEPAVGGEGEEVGGDVVPVEGSGEGGEVQPLEGAEAVVSGERQEEATDAAVTEVEGSAADRPPDDGTGDDAAQLPVDGTDKQVEEGGEEVQPEEEEVAEEEEEVEPEPEPEPEMSEEEKAAAKAQEELLAKLAAEEAEMLAKLAEEEAARQAEEEAAAAKLAEEEAARAALEAEAAAKAAEEEAARQAADAAAKARAEEEAEYARQKALAKEAAEKQAAFEAEEAERLRIEAEEAENLVIEVDDDAEEL